MTDKEKSIPIRSKLILVMQAVLVVLMSAAASCSLLPDVGDKYYILILVFTGLLVTGSVMLVFPKVSPFPFSLMVLIAASWALLSYSSLDIGITAGNEFVTAFGFTRIITSYKDMNPMTHFIILLVLGLFIVTGYLILSYLHAIQNDIREMKSADTETTEVEYFTKNHLSFLFMTLGITVFLATAVVIFLRVIHPWSIMVLGLGSVLVLGAFVYRIGMREKKK
jgi:hypothetical protein